MFRYIYINIYALLLLSIGAGHILIIILLNLHWSLICIASIVAACCIYYGCNILLSWPAKKREYKILIERNTPTFNSESFRPYMQAPCGRQLTKIVLKDLGRQQQYKELKQMQKPLFNLIHNSCQREQAKIIIYDNSHNDTPSKE